MAIIFGQKSTKIRTLYFLAYLALLSYKFEFLRTFYPRFWPYPLMKFDEILTRYRDWSLLRACRKSKYLADFSMSNHLRLRKKVFFFIFVFFRLNLMPIDDKA